MTYFVCRLYHEEKIGPFASLRAAGEYIKAQCRANPYWDHDPPFVGYWPEYPEPLGQSRWACKQDEPPSNS